MSNLPKYKIDKSFQDLLPSISKEDFSELEESIVAHGCIRNITVWEGQDLIVDGHNRYKICHKHDIVFGVEYKRFKDRDEVEAWMKVVALANPLGRKLNAFQRQHLVNSLFEEKKAQGGDTASNVAKATGLSRRTVQRDVARAKKHDELAPVLQDALKSGAIKMNDKELDEMIQFDKPSQAEMYRQVKTGECLSIADALQQNGVEEEPEEEEVAIDVDELAKPFKAASRDLQRILREMKAFAEEEKTGQYMKEAGAMFRIREGIQKALDNVKCYTPYSLCLSCNGAKCEDCNFYGWIPHGLYTKRKK